MATSEWLVPPSSSTGAQSPGLVVGDLSTPNQMALLHVGDSLITSDLSDGDTGDFSGTTGFALEFLIRVDTAFVAQTLLHGPAVLVTPTRFQWYVNLSATGVLDFNVYDGGNALHTLTFASAMSTDAPYHVVCGWNGTALWAYLNGVSQGTTAMASNPPPINAIAPAGTKNLGIAGPSSGAGLIKFDEYAIYHQNLPVARALAHYSAAFNRGFGLNYVGPRINEVLDRVSSTAPRSITLGTGSSRVLVPSYMTGQAPLEECLHALEGDDVDAAFFVAADGTLTFLPDGHRSSPPYNTSQVVFGNGASEVPFDELQMVDSTDAAIVNEVNVTAVPLFSTPTVQTASDTTSINRYFKHSQSVTSVPVSSDTYAAQIANGLLAKHKEPMTRVRSLSFDSTLPAVTDSLLDLDLMEKVTVNYQPPGGGSQISESSWIQRYDLEISNDGSPWQWTLGVSPL